MSGSCPERVGANPNVGIPNDINAAFQGKAHWLNYYIIRKYSAVQYKA